jgi:uncharacterized membrane protein
MSGLPIHPMIVHFPIVLAFLIPLATVVVLWAIWSGRWPARVWALPVALCGALALSAFVALRSGEAEEEKVEDIVAESVLHRHEEAAERFLWFSGLLMLVAAAGLAKGRVGQVGRVMATVGSLGIALSAIQVGAAGGELVYREGAARAYTEGVAPTNPAGEIGEDNRERDRR